MKLYKGGKKKVHRQWNVDLPESPLMLSEGDAGNNTYLLEKDTQSLHRLRTATKVID